MFPRNFDVNNAKIVKLQHAQSAQWKLAIKLVLKDGHFEGVWWIALVRIECSCEVPEHINEAVDYLRHHVHFTKDVSKYAQ